LESGSPESLRVLESWR